jgi:fumarate reductase subunit D
MRRGSDEGFFWTLFSSGGMLAALLLPVYLLIFALLVPLGFVHAPSYDHLHHLLLNPIMRICLFLLCSLALFHWAHRFRYTLYDGLRIKHLNLLIFSLCYGGATLGSAVALYFLLNAR